MTHLNTTQLCIVSTGRLFGKTEDRITVVGQGYHLVTGSTASRSYALKFGNDWVNFTLGRRGVGGLGLKQGANCRLTNRACKRWQGEAYLKPQIHSVTPSETPSPVGRVAQLFCLDVQLADFMLQLGLSGLSLSVTRKADFQLSPMAGFVAVVGKRV